MGFIQTSNNYKRPICSQSHWTLITTPSNLHPLTCYQCNYDNNNYQQAHYMVDHNDSPKNDLFKLGSSNNSLLGFNPWHK
jgi:hypothetical protein